MSLLSAHVSIPTEMDGDAETGTEVSETGPEKTPSPATEEVLKEHPSAAGEIIELQSIPSDGAEAVEAVEDDPLFDGSPKRRRERRKCGCLSIQEIWYIAIPFIIVAFGVLIITCYFLSISRTADPIGEPGGSQGEFI